MPTFESDHVDFSLRVFKRFSNLCQTNLIYKMTLDLISDCYREQFLCATRKYLKIGFAINCHWGVLSHLPRGQCTVNQDK